MQEKTPNRIEFDIKGPYGSRVKRFLKTVKDAPPVEISVRTSVIGAEPEIFYAGSIMTPQKSVIPVPYRLHTRVSMGSSNLDALANTADALTGHLNQQDAYFLTKRRHPRHSHLMS